MHVIDFCFSIIDKFAPMDESDKISLRKDAKEWYYGKRDEVFQAGQNKLLQKDFDLKTAPLKKKAVYWTEHWAVRTALAIMYIIVVPAIQDLHENGFREDDDKRSD